MTEKLKFFEALAEIVALVENWVPPHPFEEEVGVPVKPSGPISVFGELKLLLTDDAVLDAGMSQDPKVSAKAEVEMPKQVVTATRNNFFEYVLLFI